MACNLESAENKKLLALMEAEHPTLPKDILKHSLLFYRSGAIDALAQQHAKKKKGRKPKRKEVPSEIVGAVTITDPKSEDPVNLSAE